MTALRYVPMLKGKQGELSALSIVSPQTWQGMLPLIEATPVSGEVDVESAAVSADKLALSLGKVAGGQQVMLDAVHLDLSLDCGDDRGPLSLHCEEAEKVAVKVIPVLRPDDPSQAHQDTTVLHARHGRGVCLRLTGDDVTDDPDETVAGLDAVLERLSIDRADADLVLDLGVVTADTVKTSSLAARFLIRSLDAVDRWRSLTLASGAFPANLSGITAWQEHEQPRSDADLWADVVRRGAPRAIDFGDYAVAHPLLSGGVPFAPPPQLRYTASGHWTILEGDRRDPRGHEQFYDICQQVSESPDFAGAGLGQADAQIAGARAYGPGNATTWRKIGTAHHLDFVVRRLTSLGEP